LNVPLFIVARFAALGLRQQGWLMFAVAYPALALRSPALRDRVGTVPGYSQSRLAALDCKEQPPMIDTGGFQPRLAALFDNGANVMINAGGLLQGLKPRCSGSAFPRP
jgi:hypothetical protein